MNCLVLWFSCDDVNDSPCDGECSPPQFINRSLKQLIEQAIWMMFLHLQGKIKLK